MANVVCEEPIILSSSYTGDEPERHGDYNTKSDPPQKRTPGERTLRSVTWSPRAPP